MHYLLAQIQLTTEIETRIIRKLSAFRSKLAKAAESYGHEYLQIGENPMSLTPEQPPNYTRMQELVDEITNPSTPSNFFLHRQGLNVSIHGSASINIDSMYFQGVDQVFGHPILEKFHLDFWYDYDTSLVKKFRSSYNTTPTRMLAFSRVAVRDV